VFSEGHHGCGRQCVTEGMNKGGSGGGCRKGAYALVGRNMRGCVHSGSIPQVLK